MKKLIMGIAVVALLIGAVFFVTVTPLSMYGTGLVLNTDTQNFGRFRGVTGITTSEFVDEDLYVTSWQPDGRSIKVVCSGSATYEKGYAGSGWIGKYWYVVEMKDQNQDWTEIIWKGNYNRDVVHFTQGDCLEKKFPGIQYGNPTDDWACPSSDTTLTGESIAFYVKGIHVGGIRVKLMMKFRYWEGWSNVVKTKEILHDEAYLISGAGDLAIVGEQTVYEEGDTITFEVDTGYSGTTQGTSGEGWELRVYNSDGNEVKTWNIADDKRNLRKSYTIPDDAYKLHGSNIWKVELWNVLFNQKETEFYTIGLGMMEQIPGIPVISFDKTVYEQGDTCTVAMISEPNPLGRDAIYEFYVKAYWQGHIGSTYVYGPAFVSASGNSATVSFTLADGDKYLIVEASAWDAPSGQGGLMSETGKSMVYVKDANPEPDTFTLNVFVRHEGELVSDAIVDCGSKTITTDTSGKAIFIGLPEDTYDVKAKKTGLGSGSETIDLYEDSSITITLTKDDGEIDYLAIGIALIVFALFAVAAIFVPGGIYVKLIVIILGAILAIILYLFLGGII